MTFIYNQMVSGFRHLFPRGKFRYMLLLLSAIAATISVSELLVMKFFATLVLNEGELDSNILGLAIIGFFVFFITTRLSQYYQRNYRVKAFARSFRAAKKERTRKEENREWTMAFEITNVLSFAAQLLAIIIFFFLLNPIIAAANLLVILVILQVVGSIFQKQIKTQGKLDEKASKQQLKPEKRYAERIRAGESGALISASGTLILLALLLYLNIQGEINASNTLVIFLGTRLQNSVISNTSRSLMRYAKASASISFSDDLEE